MAFSFVSCDKDDTVSSLDLDTISTKANLVGTVYYDSGFNKAESNNEYYLPAANQTVYIAVALEDYYFGSNNNGPSPYYSLSKLPSPANVKVYKTKTNAQGKYSINIPVAEGLEVEVYAYVNFDGVYNVKVDGNEVPENVYFYGFSDSYLYANSKTVMHIFAEPEFPLEIDPNKPVK